MSVGESWQARVCIRVLSILILKQELHESWRELTNDNLYESSLNSYVLIKREPEHIAWELMRAEEREFLLEVSQLSCLGQARTRVASSDLMDFNLYSFYFSVVNLRYLKMNYAVQSATAVTFPFRRSSIVASAFGKLISPGLPTTERRVTINIGGERFQTYENTLTRYPDSLLGSVERRQKFYNAEKDELVFPLRDKNVFNAILFFYQADILSRPEDIPLEIFVEEIKFFDLARFCHEIPAPTLKTEHRPPNDTPRHRVWNFMENPQTNAARLFAKFNLLLVFTWLFILCLETSVVDLGNEKNDTRVANDKAADSSELLNVTKMTLLNESVDKTDSKEIYKGWKDQTWFILDTVFVIWFTIDYLLHLACEPRFYTLSPMGFIDLVTILPYYITLITLATGDILSPQMGVVRFFRIFRLFKVSRYSSAFRILLGSLTSSAKDFPIWFILMLMHIIFFSSILYYVESAVNNPQFSNIPDVMYFTVITMCAVGYGDAVPQSALGKLVTSIAALSGIVIVYCIPAPTLKTNFNRLNELYKSEKKEREKSKCNGSVHEINHKQSYDNLTCSWPAIFRCQQ